METGTPSLNFHLSSSTGIFYFICHRTHSHFFFKYHPYTRILQRTRVRERERESLLFNRIEAYISDWQLALRAGGLIPTFQYWLMANFRYYDFIVCFGLIVCFSLSQSTHALRSGNQGKHHTARQAN
jgi:hypothetical protein